LRCRGADRGLASETATGVQLFYLSRIMGTSVEMIGATYGHLSPTRRSTCAASSTTSTPSQVTNSQNVAIDTFATKCKHLGEPENGGTDDLA
jgi:hypothetical protein